jgi:tRNA A58 N-methylase Trm61
MLTEQQFAELYMGLPPAEPQCITQDELWFFVEFAQMFPLKRIIESGTFHGRSARLLAQAFPLCDIISWDKRREHTMIARSLYSRSGVKFRCGHLRVKDNKGHRDNNRYDLDTAVLIDGPKGSKAIRLAAALAKRCALVGIHDMDGRFDELKARFPFVVMFGSLAIVASRSPAELWTLTGKVMLTWPTHTTQ